MRVARLTDERLELTYRNINNKYMPIKKWEEMLNVFDLYPKIRQKFVEDDKKVLKFYKKILLHNKCIPKIVADMKIQGQKSFKSELRKNLIKNKVPWSEVNTEEKLINYINQKLTNKKIPKALLYRKDEIIKLYKELSIYDLVRYSPSPFNDWQSIGGRRKG